MSQYLLFRGAVYRRAIPVEHNPSMDLPEDLAEKLQQPLPSGQLRDLGVDRKWKMPRRHEPYRKLEMPVKPGQYLTSEQQKSLLSLGTQAWNTWRSAYHDHPVLKHMYTFRNNLMGVNLQFADLSYARFLDSALNTANLSFSNLRGAKFHSVDLSGADLTGVKLDPDTDFAGSWYDQATKFPRGFDPVAEGMIAKAVQPPELPPEPAAVPLTKPKVKRERKPAPAKPATRPRRTPSVEQQLPAQKFPSPLSPEEIRRIKPKPPVLPEWLAKERD